MHDLRHEESPYPKADLTLRILARLTDFALAFAAAQLHPRLGPLVAAAYLLLADGLSHGQSIGKRVFGVRAVILPRRVPAGYRESILRNAPFGLVMVFYALPLLWPVLLIAGIPIVAYEAWQVFDDRLGILELRPEREPDERGRLEPGRLRKSQACLLVGEAQLRP